MSEQVGGTETAETPAEHVRAAFATGSAEADLARRFAAGETGAFDELVAAYQTRVERLAHRLLGWRDGSDVEDVVQDVFLAALTHAKRLRSGTSVWAWLATITVNTCRSRRRRTWLWDKFIGTKKRESDSNAPAADVEIESRESLSLVRNAIERLNASDREVIVLHCLEGMAAKDVADVLGTSTNAFQVRLHRARKHLRSELKPSTESEL